MRCGLTPSTVGRDFLPRGTGIVTRRPLVLQLVNFSGDEEWAEFLHLPGRRYTDFTQVRTEIEQETSRIAGMNKGINRAPIHLKIYSPHVLNLTLVDLPGLTKIPIGDQPSDIERQVLALIREYIAKPNSIILAVSPANVDLVNSESLKLARQVDPAGRRTIGVLTKLDLMDQGTNALDILAGRVYPLKLGFIGCVNRSQQDIVGGKSLRAALQSEDEFFRSHPAYRNMANKCGTAVLARALNTILMQHIREKLPDIKARLNALMGQTQQELASYGGPMQGHAHRGSTILQLMTQFANNFVASIDGTSSTISTKELCGGARIYHIFDQVFGGALTTIDPIHNLTVSDIRTAIRNSTGPRAALFVPEQAFDLLIKPQIQLLEPASQRCVQLVYEELMKICHNCGGAELSRYPKLQMRLIEVVSDLLRERLTPTSAYVESLVEIQRAYINTNHPNFLGGAGAMSAVLRSKTDVVDKKRTLEADRAAGSPRPVVRQAHPDTQPEPVPDRLTPHVASGMTPNLTNGTNSRSSSDSFAHNLGDHEHMRQPHLNGGHASRDGFLTYFFGSKEMDQHPTANSNALHQHHSHQHHAAKQGASVAPIPNGIPGAAPSGMTGEHGLEYAFRQQLGGHMFEVAEPQLTEKERMETELIQKLIISYFAIVREAIQDQVPKAVMHLLVNWTKGNIQNRLVTELYKEEYFDTLLYEDEYVAQERDKCSKLLEVYSEANRIIQEVL